MIDLTINKESLEQNIKKAKENNVVLPTFAQMRNPDTQVTDEVKDKLKNVGLWDINPLNLYRITWKNEPKMQGGNYGKPNYIELPSKLTGVDAKIICMVGKYFPTGCHKVGASFGCLVPRLVTGQFNSATQKAVWPSTGNYCRGGAFNSKLLACDSVAILPEGMSRERFDWLRTIAGEIIATPGSESNVKEIFDATNDIRKNRKDAVIFNQFEEMGNYLWHFEVTGNAISEAFDDLSIKMSEDGLAPNFAGICLMSGSAGSMAAGDQLKQKYPNSKIAVGEALQCPTILNNGFGDHRIEGTGDKHIPWVHNVKNTDMVIAIDDEDAMQLLRLFNTETGKEFLIKEIGMTEYDVEKLSYMGISGVANMLCAIKFAKHYELTSNDVVATILTDSVEMYISRLEELQEAEGDYTVKKAVSDYTRRILGASTDHLLELPYNERKRVHNLKYYTWVEQQDRCVNDLNAQWYDQTNTFESVQKQASQIDELIVEFNNKVSKC
ncbi:MAG: pyridoxal-5-phosphate-dependent protein subunit beta [Oscillospiraceae bacterium]|nr:pyridoxal-5-phosphate-dependent protein subunit beta [Oscillospiraceae bacterium]